MIPYTFKIRVLDSMVAKPLSMIEEMKHLRAAEADIATKATFDNNISLLGWLYARNIRWQAQKWHNEDNVEDGGK